MIQIIEVNIISIDKGEETWEIEGEIVFEDDLSTLFETTYFPDDDELEDLHLEIDPGDYDKVVLKDMIVSASQESDE